MEVEIFGGPNDGTVLHTKPANGKPPVEIVWGGTIYVLLDIRSKNGTPKYRKK